MNTSVKVMLLIGCAVLCFTAFFVGRAKDYRDALSTCESKLAVVSQHTGNKVEKSFCNPAGQCVGDPCVGIGKCGKGIFERSYGNPLMLICSTMPGGSQDGSSIEICDGIDNNCDGVLDEGCKE